MRGTCVPHVFRRVVVGFFLQDYLIPSGEEAKEKIAHNLMRTKEVPK